MCVRFYVLNHSKYRFPFNAVYIGIMNGIRKPDLSCCKIQPTEIPRFRCPLHDRSSPYRGLCFGARMVVILHRETTQPSEAVAEVLHRFFENFSAADFSPSLRWRASCTFVCRKNFRHTKGARSARPGGVPESRHLLQPTIWIPSSKTDGSDDPTTTDPRRPQV